MNYSTSIKRAYLTAISLVTLFFLLIFAGLLGHFFYVETAMIRSGVIEKGLAREKNFIKDRADSFISGLESDFKFCSDRNIGSVAEPSCDMALIVEMAKKRMASKSADIIIELEKVLGRGKESGSLNSGGRQDGPAEYFKDEEFINEVVEKGELFINGDTSMVQPRVEPEKLIFAKYYKRFNWIVTASADSSVLLKKFEGEYALERKEALQSTLKGLVPVLFFVVLAYISAYALFLRISKIIRMQEGDSCVDDEACTSLAAQTEELEGVHALSDAGQRYMQRLMQGAEEVFLIYAACRRGTFTVVQISRGIETALGYSEADIVGKTLDSIVKAGEVGRGEPPLINFPLSENTSGGEGIFLGKNGENIPVQYSVHHVRGEMGELLGAFIAAFDISRFLEIRRMLDRTQERLLQSQKLEAIGILAGGIAHDFNNVLSSIVGYSELLKEQLEPGSMERDDLEQILLATNRAVSLVKQIHAFSRSKALENSYFEPGLIVKETLKMLRSTIPPSIAIKQDIRLQGETIYANTTRFHQLLMNLCTNAFQAMENGGGQLKVRLRCVEDTRHMPEGFKLCGEKYLELMVSDNGCGISPDFQNSIVDSMNPGPKDGPTGETRLHDDFNMIRNIGGAMWIRKNEPEGTVIYALFPVKQERGLGWKRGERLDVPQGTETILFVDDEPDIINVTRIMLEGLGYTVCCVSNGADALLKFKEMQGIDLIITDQSMPEMTGAELVKEIRRISSVPVILCTGYSARISEENWRNLGVSGFIMKPFRKRDIARLIRDTLAGGNMIKPQKFTETLTP